MFLGAVVLPLEVVAVVVEHLSRTLNMGLLPCCLHLCAVGESRDSPSLFAAVDEGPLKESAVRVAVAALPILFAPFPGALVLVPVRVLHPALSVLDVIEPIARVDIPITVEVGPEALLALLDGPLEALPVSEEADPPLKGVALPVPEVDVTLEAGEDAPPFPLLAALLHLPVVGALVEVLLGD